MNSPNHAYTRAIEHVKMKNNNGSGHHSFETSTPNFCNLVFSWLTFEANFTQPTKPAQFRQRKYIFFYPTYIFEINIRKISSFYQLDMFFQTKI